MSQLTYFLLFLVNLLKSVLSCFLIDEDHRVSFITFLCCRQIHELFTTGPFHAMELTRDVSIFEVFEVVY